MAKRLAMLRKIATDFVQLRCEIETGDPEDIIRKEDAAVEKLVAEEDS